MIACALVLILALAGPAAAQVAPPALLDLPAIDRLIASGDFAAAETASRALTDSLAARGEIATLRVADVLDRWAKAIDELQRGADPAARDVAIRAIQIRETLAGAESPDLPIPYTVLWSIEDLRGDYQAAMAAAERGAAIAARAWAADDPRLGRVTYALAAGAFRTGAFDRADGLFRQALAIEERIHSPLHIDLARANHGYGLFLVGSGRFAEARPLLERAVAMREQLFGADSLNVAVSLNALGTLGASNGDYIAARAALTRALDIRKRRLGPDHLFIAQTELWLATVEKDLGDYVPARAGYQRGLAMLQRVAPRHQMVSLFQVRLGDLYLRTGDYQAAQAVIEPAAADLATRANNDLAGWAMRATAELRYALGDYAGAVTMGRQALEVLARQRGDTDWDTGTASRVLARALARTGAIDESILLYERAIGVLDASLGPSHPETTETRTQYAQLLLDRGRFADASRQALQAERPSREQARLVVRSLPERQAMLYATAARNSLDVVLSAVERQAADRTAVADALDAVTHARALVLDEIGKRSYVLRRAGNAEQALEERFVRTRERLARLIVRGPDTGLTIAQYTALIAAARQEQEQAENALAAVSARLRNERRERRIGLDDIRAALPPDAALLSYVRYRRVAAGDDAYGVFITRRTAPPSFVPLGVAAPVDAAIAAVRGQILREASTPGRAARVNEAGYRREGTALRRLVWDPVSVHVGDAARIFIVTDGSLGLVSFGALPLGTNRYVVDGTAALHYLTAERDLTRDAQPSTSRTLVSLGNPDFDARDTEVVASAATSLRGTGTPCTDFGSLRFDRLPASASEAATIAGMWNPADAIQLLGARASKTSLKQYAPDARIIHLATHGFFLGAGCGGDNPLLLSGLALAGANGRADVPADGDNGMLTSEEIAALDLSGVEWAVLSACDTGLGSIVAGEGVLGLQRAFQLAGASTVIMSLWPIDDRSTERWMTALYDERVARRQSTAEAVRGADRRMLAERRRDGRSTHPFYWAAFVATGDWR